MLNLVIKMEKGKIYEIVWDNGCFTCNDDKCQKNLVSRSIDNEKDIRTFVFPDDDHSLAGHRSRIYLMRNMFQFLEEKLK